MTTINAHFKTYIDLKITYFLISYLRSIMFSCRYISVCKQHKIVLMPTLYYRRWAKKLSSNFYQNP